MEGAPAPSARVSPASWVGPGLLPPGSRPVPGLGEATCPLWASLPESQSLLPSACGAMGDAHALWGDREQGRVLGQPQQARVDGQVWASAPSRPLTLSRAFLRTQLCLPILPPAPRPARSCGTAAVTGSGARLPALSTWCVRSGATSGLCRAWLLDRTQAACMANLRSRLGCPPHPFSARDRWLPTTKLHPLWSMHPSLHREQPKGLWAAPAGQRALVCVGQHMSIRALVTQGTPGSTSW